MTEYAGIEHKRPKGLIHLNAIQVGPQEKPIVRKDILMPAVIWTSRPTDARKRS